MSNSRYLKSMKKFWLIGLVILIYGSSIGQASIKVMSYNLLKFPNGISTDRYNDLVYIVNQAQPDILMVCELQDHNSSDTIVTYMNAQYNHYSAAGFEYNHSGSYQDLNQMLYYNNQKFELITQSYLTTTVRDIDYYTLKMKTIDATTNPIYIEVYVAHFKANDNTSNNQYSEQTREDMAQVFVNHLNQVPANHYVIFGGDLNLYRSTEGAYQKLIDPNNPIVMIDPKNPQRNTQYWHNNTNFTAIHTQSTHIQNIGNFAGGGLDDRFDFIFLSENFFTSNTLYYVNNSYKAFGNNGNCFNKNINDSSCDGFYDQTLRQHLYNMSDHLPVVLTLETTATLSNPELAENINVRFGNGNIIYKDMTLTGDFDFLEKIEIFDISGKKVYDKHNYFKNQPINLQKIKKGIYFVRLIVNNRQKILKFVKQ